MTASIPAELLERVWFYTNFDCGLQCAYCVAALGPGIERPGMDLSCFRPLVDEAISLGFQQVALTGGEPFLHPQIVDMIAYATASIDTVVLTNGLRITPALLDDLQQADRNRLTIQVSLDSADPAINDRLRGRGTWRRAWRGLKLLVESHYTVAVRATLDGQDETTLEDLTEVLRSLGVPAERVYGAPVARVGRAMHGLELSRESLWPEPTVIGDGLYWHPLLIDPATALTQQIEPLDVALQVLVAEVEVIRPSRPKDVR